MSGGSASCSLLASVPLDGSPGPSGVTFKQLKQMGALSGGAEILRQACEAILNGKSPVKERMCQGNLIALKKDGSKGIRPIAISENLLRLAGPIACRGKFFNGVKFGAGTKGGLEAVVHACRADVRAGKYLLQVDWKIAFNSISPNGLLSLPKRALACGHYVALVLQKAWIQSVCGNFSVLVFLNSISAIGPNPPVVSTANGITSRSGSFSVLRASPSTTSAPTPFLRHWGRGRHINQPITMVIVGYNVNYPMLHFRFHLHRDPTFVQCPH